MKEVEILDKATHALARVNDMATAWEAIQGAEAAQKLVRIINLGTNAINLATGIKAKAELLFLEYVEQGQAEGTIARRGQNDGTRALCGHPGTLVERSTSWAGAHGCSRREHPLDRRLCPGDRLETSDQRALKRAYRARRLREAVGDAAGIDALVTRPTEEGIDLRSRGLLRAGQESKIPEPVREPLPPPGACRWTATKRAMMVPLSAGQPIVRLCVSKCLTSAMGVPSRRDQIRSSGSGLQTWRMARKPDRYEQCARERLEPSLGSLPCIDPGGGPLGAHDYEADLSNGSFAAIEVTGERSGRWSRC